MPDIFQHFLIHAPASKVFHGISTPHGLDTWWTKSSSRHGDELELFFGANHDWRAKVSRSVADREFEIEITKADGDWTGTRMGFVLEETKGDTQVRFHHTGWPQSNDHYRISCYCWAMYLRLLKRNVEQGEVIPFERRLEV
jgi:uncharacterized protein YndB with AHSA1/START domain